ncbi:DUF3298 and DUF4163 domain-containing protein [Oscillospiraceae bacterium WX1]
MMTISEETLTEDLTFEGVTMVRTDFHYPVVSGGGGKADRRINSYYRHMAKTLMKKAKSDLLPDAVAEWRYATENGYPFREFESVMKFTVTYNENDLLSLYFDVYDFTGGAHGATRRFGDTWRTETGWFIMLSDFFPRGTNYKRLLIDNAIVIATQQTRAGTHHYFENYPKLIKKYFSPAKFYIEPGNIVIFYDQYAIAPYYEGIPVFQYPADIKTHP